MENVFGTSEYTSGISSDVTTPADTENRGWGTFALDTAIQAGAQPALSVARTIAQGARAVGGETGFAADADKWIGRQQKSLDEMLSPRAKALGQNSLVPGADDRSFWNEPVATSFNAILPSVPWALATILTGGGALAGAGLTAAQGVFGGNEAVNQLRDYADQTDIKDLMKMEPFAAYMRNNGGDEIDARNQLFKDSLDPKSLAFNYLVNALEVPAFMRGLGKGATGIARGARTGIKDRVKGAFEGAAEGAFLGAAEGGTESYIEQHAKVKRGEQDAMDFREVEKGMAQGAVFAGPVAAFHAVAPPVHARPQKMDSSEIDALEKQIHGELQGGAPGPGRQPGGPAMPSQPAAPGGDYEQWGPGDIPPGAGGGGAGPAPGIPRPNVQPDVREEPTQPAAPTGEPWGETATYDPNRPIDQSQTLTKDTDLDGDPYHSFKTSSGSEYFVFNDGTTVRNRVPNQGEDPSTGGLRERSFGTLFLTPEHAQLIDNFLKRTTQFTKMFAPTRDGQWGIKYTSGPSAGKFERSTVAPVRGMPVVGLRPVEFFSKNRYHFGSPITEVGQPAGAAPNAPPRSQAAPAPTVDPRIGETMPDVQTPVVTPEAPLPPMFPDIEEPGVAWPGPAGESEDARHREDPNQPVGFEHEPTRENLEISEEAEDLIRGGVAVHSAEDRQKFADQLTENYTAGKKGRDLIPDGLRQSLTAAEQKALRDALSIDAEMAIDFVRRPPLTMEGSQALQELQTRMASRKKQAEHEERTKQEQLKREERERKAQETAKAKPVGPTPGMERALERSIGAYSAAPASGQTQERYENLRKRAIVVDRQLSSIGQKPKYLDRIASPDAMRRIRERERQQGMAAAQAKRAGGQLQMLFKYPERKAKPAPKKVYPKGLAGHRQIVIDQFNKNIADLMQRMNASVTHLRQGQHLFGELMELNAQRVREKLPQLPIPSVLYDAMVDAGMTDLDAAYRWASSKDKAEYDRVKAETDMRARLEIARRRGPVYDPQARGKATKVSERLKAIRAKGEGSLPANKGTVAEGVIPQPVLSRPKAGITDPFSRSAEALSRWAKRFLNSARYGFTEKGKKRSVKAAGISWDEYLKRAWEARYTQAQERMREGKEPLRRSSTIRGVPVKGKGDRGSLAGKLPTLQEALEAFRAGRDPARAGGRMQKSRDARHIIREGVIKSSLTDFIKKRFGSQARFETLLRKLLILHNLPRNIDRVTSSRGTQGVVNTRLPEGSSEEMKKWFAKLIGTTAETVVKGRVKLVEDDKVVETPRVWLAAKREEIALMQQLHTFFTASFDRINADLESAKKKHSPKAKGKRSGIIWRLAERTEKMEKDPVTGKPRRTGQYTFQSGTEDERFAYYNFANDLQKFNETLRQTLANLEGIDKADRIAAGSISKGRPGREVGQGKYRFATIPEEFSIQMRNFDKRLGEFINTMELYLGGNMEAVSAKRRFVLAGETESRKGESYEGTTEETGTEPVPAEEQTEYEFANEAIEGKMYSLDTASRLAEARAEQDESTASTLREEVAQETLAPEPKRDEKTGEEIIPEVGDVPAFIGGGSHAATTQGRNTVEQESVNLVDRRMKIEKIKGKFQFETDEEYAARQKAAAEQKARRARFLAQNPESNIKWTAHLAKAKNLFVGMFSKGLPVDHLRTHPANPDIPDAPKNFTRLFSIDGGKSFTRDPPSLLADASYVDVPDADAELMYRDGVPKEMADKAQPLQPQVDRLNAAREAADQLDLPGEPDHPSISPPRTATEIFGRLKYLLSTGQLPDFATPYVTGDFLDRLAAITTGVNTYLAPFDAVTKLNTQGHGYYSQDFDRVVLSDDVSDRLYAQSAIHEYVHAALTWLLKHDKAFGHAANRLWKRAVEHAQRQGVDMTNLPDELYGLKDPAEMLSETAATPEFRKFLEGVKAPGHPIIHGAHNLINAIYRAVRDTFRRAMGYKHGDTALDAFYFDQSTVLGQADRLIGQMTKRVERKGRNAALAPGPGKGINLSDGNYFIKKAGARAFVGDIVGATKATGHELGDAARHAWNDLDKNQGRGLTWHTLYDMSQRGSAAFKELTGKLFKAVENSHAERARIMREIDAPKLARIEKFLNTIADKKDAAEAQDILIDESIHEAFVDAELSDVRNRHLHKALTKEEKEAGVTTTSFNDSLRNAQIKRDHPVMMERYKNFIAKYPQFAEIRHMIHAWAKEREVEMRSGRIQDLLKAAGIVPETTPFAERKALLDALEKLVDNKVDVKDMSKSELAVLAKHIGDPTTSTKEAKELVGKLKKISEIEDIATKVSGPYTPFVRRGDIAISGRLKFPVPTNAVRLEGGTNRDTGEKVGEPRYVFKTRAEAEAWEEKISKEYGAKLIKAGTIYMDNATDTPAMGDDPENPDNQVLLRGKQLKKAIEGGADISERFYLQFQTKLLSFHATDRDATKAREAWIKQFGADKVELTQPKDVTKFDGRQNELYVSTQLDNAIRTVRASDAYGNLHKAQQGSITNALNMAAAQYTMRRGIKQRYLPRGYVQGMSRNILENYNEWSGMTAGYLAKTRFANDVDQHSKAIRDYVKANEYQQGDANAGVHSRVYNEFMHRLHTPSTNPRDTWLNRSIDRGLRFTMLDKLPSIAYFVVQATEPAVVGAPLMTDRHSMPQVVGTMKGMYAVAGASRFFAEGWRDIKKAWGKSSEERFDWPKLFGERLDKEPDGTRMKNLMKQAGERNMFDASSSLDFDRSFTTSRNRIDRTADWLQGMFQAANTAVENLNRFVILGTAYRLEYGRLVKAAKEGANFDALHQQAVDYALAKTHEASGVYATYNAPPIFGSTMLGKVVFQFKKYPQRIMANYIRAMVGTIKGGAQLARGESVSQENIERARQLAYMLATQALVAGVMGLPTELFAIPLNTLHIAGLSDYNWDDVQAGFREFAAKQFGPQVGELLSHGVLRLTGVDFASRLGQSTLATFGSPSSTKPHDLQASLFAMFSGALGSSSFEFLQGVQKFSAGVSAANSGVNDVAYKNFSEAARHLALFRMVGDVIDATRKMTPEGMQTASGRTMREPYGPWEAVARAAGFTPAREAESSEARRAIDMATQRLKSNRKGLVDLWVQASPSQRGELWRNDIQPWNDRQPHDDRLTQSDLLKALGVRQKAERQPSTALGLPTDKRSRQFMPMAETYMMQ